LARSVLKSGPLSSVLRRLAITAPGVPLPRQLLVVLRSRAPKDRCAVYFGPLLRRVVQVAPL
jgi:hypothetical protein